MMAASSKLWHSVISVAEEADLSGIGAELRWSWWMQTVMKKARECWSGFCDVLYNIISIRKMEEYFDISSTIVAGRYYQILAQSWDRLIGRKLWSQG